MTNSIASAQGQVESQNFDSRKNVLKYDDVMNRQREVIYGERRAVLEGADLHEQIRSMIDEVVEGYVVAATDGFPEEWDLDALWQALKQLYPISLSLRQVEEEAGGRDGLTRESLVEDIKADAQAAYDRREAEFGDEVMRELERRVLLSVLDRKWREHLYEMDYLREGIGLRAYSQRDPLVEYQREGFDMFAAMMDGIKEESVGYMFNLEVQVEDEADEAAAEEIEVGPALAQAAASSGLHDHPSIHAKGLDAPDAAAEPVLLRAVRGRRRRAQRLPADRSGAQRAGVRRHQPQRRVPLRLRQEVQEVPRRARRPDRPDDPRERLTRSTPWAETPA